MFVRCDVLINCRHQSSRKAVVLAFQCNAISPTWDGRDLFLHQSLFTGHTEQSRVGSLNGSIVEPWSCVAMVNRDFIGDCLQNGNFVPISI